MLLQEPDHLNTSHVDEKTRQQKGKPTSVINSHLRVFHE